MFLFNNNSHNEKPLVIHISIDGWRPETIKEMPQISKLITEGFCTLNCKSDPEHTNTLPNHISQLTSVPVSEHKWTTNFPNKCIKTDIHINKKGFQHSIFSHLESKKIKTGLVIQKERLYRLIVDSYPEISNHKNIDSHHFPSYGTKETFDYLFQQIKKTDITYYFVHLQGPDLVGHHDKLKKGEPYRPWGFNPLNKNMIQTLKVIDEQIGNLRKLLIKVKKNRKTMLLISSDHGGIADSNDHYADPSNPQNNTIPMILWGTDIFNNKKVDMNHKIMNRYIGNFVCKFLDIDKIKDTTDDAFAEYDKLF